jgi:hypothetical protein
MKLRYTRETPNWSWTAYGESLCLYSYGLYTLACVCVCVCVCMRVWVYLVCVFVCVCVCQVFKNRAYVLRRQRMQAQYQAARAVAREQDDIKRKVEAAIAAASQQVHKPETLQP